MATFADRLKALREARGMSQQELADKLDVNKQTISGYERGVRRPAGENALDMYVALADVFNVDLMYLLGQHDYVERIAGEGSDPADANIKASLNSDELNLIRAYRNADDRTRRLVAYALGLSEYMTK